MGKRQTTSSGQNSSLPPASSSPQPVSDGTGNSSYDPQQFILAASDSQGHSARVFCRVMPGITQQLEYVMQTHAFPYRTKGDILRHALHRHLAWLTTLEPMKSVMGQVDAIAEVLREEEQASEFQVSFDRRAARISSFSQQRAEGEARRMVLNVTRLIGGMQDGYWRDKYLAELESRWGYMIEQAPRAALVMAKNPENPVDEQTG